MFADSMRERRLNTTIPRTKKRSTSRRLLQITAWVDEPLMLKLTLKARKKNLSMSSTVRALLRKVVSEDDERVDAALDPEMIDRRIARGNRALASQLSRLLAWLLYDTGQVKALANNTLGMQKGMTEQMHKDILKDADRQTKARFTRMNPDLAEFMDAIEKWLLSETRQQANGKPPGSSGTIGRGGRGF